MQKASLLVLLFLFIGASAAIASAPVSEKTEECLSCHAEVTPGIVADWKRSLHSRVTPEEGLKKPALQRRVSSENVPETLLTTVVGCAECHTLKPDTHKGTFDHNGRQRVLQLHRTTCGHL